MGLFGPSKKEKLLQAEIDRLNELLLPEHREIEALTEHIRSLKGSISNLESAIFDYNNRIDNQKNIIDNLEQEIIEKKKQLSVFLRDIHSLDYGLYMRTP